jgi:hypothetical protein
MPVDWAPLADLVPDQAPDAEQDLALAADHRRVELVPLEMVLGEALMLTLGAFDRTEIVADWVARPPEPVQVRV